MDWELNEAIAYYRKQGAPGDQNALIQLLKECQSQLGSLTTGCLAAIAEGYGVKQSLLLAIVKRIPSLRLEDGHCLEICAGARCGRHPELAETARKLQRQGVSVRQVPCMRMCGKGPNIRWDGKLYSGATEALLRQLAEGKK